MQQSFSNLQKEKIISEHFKSPCCRKALLQGVLYTRAYICDSEIRLSLSGEAVIEYVTRLISNIYGNIPEVKTPSYGGRAKLISFKSPACEKYLLSLDSSNAIYERKCNKCRSAFLRGVFLGAGRVAEPEKQFLMEFSFADVTERIEVFSEHLALFEIESKYMKRNNENIVYIKKSSCIENFFAECDLKAAYFRFADAKINKQIRNEANRRVNCETNNITRAVNASQNQIAVIMELEKRGMLSSLPEELEKTAILRIKHMDLSLSDLAKVSVPPISKSGLSHRLNKIKEIGERILGKN